MEPLAIILRFLSITVAGAIAVLGVYSLLALPVSIWGSVSMAISLLLLIVSAVAVLRYPDSFFSNVAFLYAGVLSGRLFSTLRLPSDFQATGTAALDPLLLGETGPGITAIMWLSYLLVGLLTVQLLQLVRQSQDMSRNDWALTFLRIYVGLMFIAHYTGHILAGPDQFQIFTDYFATVGLEIGAPMVVLAGLIEVAVSIGLVFGFMTRAAALGGALYLFLSALWGGHFAAGYVWVLPGGGWEFPVLWIFILLLIAVTGGGLMSIDRWLKEKP